MRGQPSTAKGDLQHVPELHCGTGNPKQDDRSKDGSASAVSQSPCRHSRKWN